MEGMVAVLILKLFVVKTGTVATMHRLAVSHLVVAFTLMGFVVRLLLAVAPMEPNVMKNTPNAWGHIFCLC